MAIAFILNTQKRSQMLSVLSDLIASKLNAADTDTFGPHISPAEAYLQPIDVNVFW